MQEFCKICHLIGHFLTRFTEKRNYVYDLKWHPRENKHYSHCKQHHSKPFVMLSGPPDAVSPRKAELHPEPYHHV